MHKIASENQKKFYANRNLMKKPPIFPAISTGFPKKIFVFWLCNLQLSPEIRQKFQFSAKIIHLFILKKIGSSSDSNLSSENSRIFFAYIQESDVLYLTHVLLFRNGGIWSKHIRGREYPSQLPLLALHWASMFCWSVCESETP